MCGKELNAWTGKAESEKSSSSHPRIGHEKTQGGWCVGVTVRIPGPSASTERKQTIATFSAPLSTSQVKTKQGVVNIRFCRSQFES